MSRLDKDMKIEIFTTGKQIEKKKPEKTPDKNTEQNIPEIWKNYKKDNKNVKGLPGEKKERKKSKQY